MIDIDRLGNNETLVFMGKCTVLFSYNTPVAGFTNGKYYRTDKYHSVTTSKHINKWLDGQSATVIPQSTMNEFDKFATGQQED